MAGFSIYAFALFLSILLAWFFGFSRKRQPGANEPPLMNGWIPYLGVALNYGRNPLAFLRSAQKKYGDIFTCKIAGRYMTFITDPFSYNAVIRQGKNLDFQKFALGFSSKVFGHSDFSDPAYTSSYKDVHIIFRQTLQGPVLEQLISSMMDNTQIVMQRNKPTGWITEGLQSFTHRIMFEAGYMTFFGKEEEAQAEEDRVEKRPLMKRIEDFLAFDRAFPQMAAGLPIYFCFRAFKGREALVEMLYHKYLKRKRDLSALIERRMYAFDRMRPMLDELGKARTHVGMLWASQANTLPAAFWSLYYMLRSAEALRAAQNEVDRVLRDHNPVIPGKPLSLSKDQLDSMSALGSIIDEALRLSSASVMIRVVSDNFSLTLDSGLTRDIRKGDYVALYPQMIHLDPEVYENPMEFKFDRFLDENGQKKTDFYKNGRRLKQFLIPFGSGASECPGRFFAIYEIKQFLTLVLWQYEIELEDVASARLATDCTRAGLGILPPKHDVQLRYRIREFAEPMEGRPHIG